MADSPQRPARRQATVPALPSDLRHQLRTAGRRRLRQLVEEYGRFLEIGDVRQALMNPFVEAEVLEELAANRKLTSDRSVKAALARHHRTPPRIAMRFVSGLFWRELLEITLDVRIGAAVRRLAENYLVQRLPRLSIGEKVALARRAVGRVASVLVVEPSLSILDALLANPRLTEQELMPLLTSRRSQPRALHEVARSERWGTRYEVRLALCRHPGTPSRDVVRLLPGLQREDLEAVATIEEHGWLVRHRAQQILDEWPFDRFRGRAGRIARQDEQPIELDAETPDDPERLAELATDALQDAIDSSRS